MKDVITIQFPRDTGSETLKELRGELIAVKEVAGVGAATTRTVGVTDLALWVGFAADAMSVASLAVAALNNVIDRVRAKGVRGAIIELPNGVKISVESASADEILSLVSAWKGEDAQRSGEGTPGK